MHSGKIVANTLSIPSEPALSNSLDWKHVARTVLISRSIDHIEETELVPAKKVLYQFSARGHDVVQSLLSQFLYDPMDAVCGYDSGSN